MKEREVLALMPDGTFKPFLDLMDEIDRKYEEELRRKTKRVYKYSMMGASQW